MRVARSALFSHTARAIKGFQDFLLTPLKETWGMVRLYHKVNKKEEMVSFSA